MIKPNFRLAEVTQKEEIGKGIIELAKVNCSKTRCSTVRVVMIEVGKLQTQNTLLSLLMVTIICYCYCYCYCNVVSSMEFSYIYRQKGIFSFYKKVVTLNRNGLK